MNQADQSIAELRTKARNLMALAKGVQMDLATTKKDDKTERLMFTIQAHLSQASDALDVLQMKYPLKELGQ